MLIVGFGPHNATEGFGIVAPMAAVGERPSWRCPGLLGLIGGGPTIGLVAGFPTDAIVTLGVAWDPARDGRSRQGDEGPPAARR